MPVPAIVWAGVALGGVLATSRLAREAGDMADSATTLTKWVVAGGTLYVSYRALKAGGVL